MINEIKVMEKTENKDLTKMYRKVVKQILMDKKISIDIDDDDSMFELCYGLYEYGFEGFSFKEITQLLMYNSFLNQEVASMGSSKFIVKRVKIS